MGVMSDTVNADTFSSFDCLLLLHMITSRLKYV